MSTETTSEQIEELTKKLEKLVVEQDDINSRVAATRSKVKVLHELAQEETRKQNENRTEAIAGSGYFIGDLVDIQNPSPGQEVRGKVVGKTKDNLLRIQTETGVTIRRIPRNVQLS